jgi:peptide deformylase
MGDARLLRQAQPVERFDEPGLHALIADMEETMHHHDGILYPMRMRDLSRFGFTDALEAAAAD